MTAKRFLLIVASLVLALTIFLSGAIVYRLTIEPTPQAVAQDADASIPPIGEVAEEPTEAPTPTLAPTTAPAEPAEEPAEEPVEGPTPTPWPSIFMAKGEVVAIPAEYTIAGDISVCASAEPSSCVGTYDDLPDTTGVWHFEADGFARYDFGDGWAEHVSDPQVFVDAQKSDGCGNGCSEVYLKEYPADAAEYGLEVQALQVQPTAENTATEEPTTAEGTPAPRVLDATAPDGWMLPSWAEVAPEAAETQLQAMGVKAADVQSWMMPEALPLVPPDELVYQTPPEGDCYALNNALDSCTTGRLRPISFEDVEIAPGQLLRMTGDAISIRWSDTGELLAARPDGDEKHDNWVVLNLSSQAIEVDINAPYGSDRSWYTATNGWNPVLVDELTRQMIQDFNLQVRDEAEFAATPVPNCEAAMGCAHSNVRIVVIFDDEVLVFTGKWFENLEPHWEAFAPSSFDR